jgi:hypothetical protein
MKYKLLLIVLFINNLLIFSQNKNYHYIELLPNKTETTENVDFYVSAVYDNRAYKGNIGIAQKGVFNKKVLAKFKKPFNKELLDYLETVFPKDTTKTPIILRINKLLISEDTRVFKEVGKAIVSLDVLIKTKSEYGLLGSFSAIKEKNSVDVTGKHDDRIRADLKDCLMQFNATNWGKITPIQVKLKKVGAPKTLTENYKTGFYNSSMELFNNQTLLDTTFNVVTKKSKGDKLVLRNQKNKSPIYFAYSNGKDLYLNASNYSADNHFIKTYRLDQFVLFNDTFLNQNKAVGMSLAFGVLGVFIATEHQNVLFDLNTGEFFPLNRSKMKLLIEEKYPNLFKNFKKNAKDINKVIEILKYVFAKDNKAEVRAILRG